MDSTTQILQALAAESPLLLPALGLGAVLCLMAVADLIAGLSGQRALHHYAEANSLLPAANHDDAIQAAQRAIRTGEQLQTNRLRP